MFRYICMVLFTTLRIDNKRVMGHIPHIRHPGPAGTKSPYYLKAISIMHAYTMKISINICWPLRTYEHFWKGMKNWIHTKSQSLSSSTRSISNTTTQQKNIQNFDLCNSDDFIKHYTCVACNFEFRTINFNLSLTYTMYFRTPWKTVISVQLRVIQRCLNCTKLTISYHRLTLADINSLWTPSKHLSSNLKDKVIRLLLTTGEPVTSEIVARPKSSLATFFFFFFF